MEVAGALELAARDIEGAGDVVDFCKVGSLLAGEEDDGYLGSGCPEAGFRRGDPFYGYAFWEGCSSLSVTRKGRGGSSIYPLGCWRRARCPRTSRPRGWWAP